MKFLITGGTGFIGSNFVNYLVSKEFSVTLLSKSKILDQFTLDVQRKLTVVGYDQVEDNNFEFLWQEFDVLVLFGWEGVAGFLRNDPMQLHNVSSVLSIVHKYSSAGGKRVIGVGSQAEYGPKTKRIYEDEAECPTDLYGLAKLMTCRSLMSMRGFYPATSFSWVRIFSVYGPGDSESWLIPQIIKSLLSQNEIELTKGEQIWDYLHVEDAVLALFQICRAGNLHDVYNLGSGVPVKLRDIFNFLGEELNGVKFLQIGKRPYRRDQVMHLEADISNLNSIGWKPNKDIRTGLLEKICELKNQQ